MGRLLLSRRPWLTLGRSCWPCSSTSITGMKGILPKQRAACWSPRESQVRLLEYIKGGQMLSKSSIKKGGQVISKANSMLKWSGCCTRVHSHSLIPAHLLPYKNKPLLLKEERNSQESCVKLPALSQNQCFDCGHALEQHYSTVLQWVTGMYHGCTKRSKCLMQS